MWIGVGRIVLDFYNNDSSKLKNKKLEELCKDIRKKFNLSALEIADFQDPERCVIGFAAVMPEDWREAKAKTFVQKIAKTIDETAFARVTVQDCDVLYHGQV